MNRKTAKFLTIAGVQFCAVSILLIIYNFFRTADFSLFVSVCFFVGGIMLIVFSLAYYTEK